MSPKIIKILSLFLCFLLIFQQSGFAQGLAQLDVPGYLATFHRSLTIDKFRPLHLRYLSYDPLANTFKLLLDKGTLTNPRTGELENTTKTLLNYFFIGISLPNDSFWVNLRPDSENDVIDPFLAQTDVGKILLEADLQLKKDTAKFTSPETPEGKKYWDLLYKKAEELFGYENITIPTLTRPWIVPDEIIIRETAGEASSTERSRSAPSAYIYKATLKVMLEQDYLKDSSTYNFKDLRLKALNEYSSQLIRELIIPKLTKEINTSKKYASLRQVYYSLIIAQWFKARFNQKGLSPSEQIRSSPKGTVPNLIDSRNLTNLTSKEPWSKTTYFQAYQKSFKDGEYSLKEPVYTPFGQTVRSYFSGGIQIITAMPGFGQPAVVDPTTGSRTLKTPSTGVEIKSANNVGITVNPVTNQIKIEGDLGHRLAESVQQDVKGREDEKRPDERLFEYIERLKKKYGEHVEIEVVYTKETLERKAKEYGFKGDVGAGFGVAGKTINDRAYVCVLYDEIEQNPDFLIHEITEALLRGSKGIARGGAQTGEVNKHSGNDKVGWIKRYAQKLTVSGSPEFKPGEVNTPEAIRAIKTISGNSIVEINKRAQPGAYADSGFADDVIEQMVIDNETVRKLGVTHKHLAKLLLEAVSRFEKGEREFEYNGMRFKIDYFTTRGLQYSIFADDVWSDEYDLINVTQGVTIQFAPSQIAEISQLGFYEARVVADKKNPYGVDPELLWRMFYDKKFRVSEITVEEALERQVHQTKEKEGWESVYIYTLSQLNKKYPFMRKYMGRSVGGEPFYIKSDDEYPDTSFVYEVRKKENWMIVLKVRIIPKEFVSENTGSRADFYRYGLEVLRNDQSIFFSNSFTIKDSPEAEVNLVNILQSLTTSPGVKITPDEAWFYSVIKKQSPETLLGFAIAALVKNLEYTKMIHEIFPGEDVWFLEYNVGASVNRFDIFYRKGNLGKAITLERQTEIILTVLNETMSSDRTQLIPPSEAKGVSLSATGKTLPITETKLHTLDSDKTRGAFSQGKSKSHDESQRDTSTRSVTGGIDFRALPIVTQAIGNLSANIRNVPLARFDKVNLDEELLDIERLVNSGIWPSAERIKEYIQASCAKARAEEDIEKIILCISDILRLEEEYCYSTDPVLRDILVVLEATGSAAELKDVFLGKAI